MRGGVGALALVVACSASPLPQTTTTETPPVVGDGTCPVLGTRAEGMNLTEVQAQGPNEEEVWALFFFDPNGGVVGEELKIVFRMTGSGDPTFGALTLGRTFPIEPSWGPTFHDDSNWNRPGDEWGTAWIFPTPGCWTIRALRGSFFATITLPINPPPN